jgi:hypothetical protein
MRGMLAAGKSTMVDDVHRRSLCFKISALQAGVRFIALWVPTTSSEDWASIVLVFG